jgi:sortase A
VILLWVSACVCLTLCLLLVFEASYFQASLSRALDVQRQGSPRKMRDLVGRLEIPRIGLEVMVLNGADPATLRRGAGWMPETARPGATGNVAIAAHRDMHFRPLRKIEPGDVIQITTPDDRYDYRVQWTAVVSPDDTSVLAPTGKPTLTLITCYPFYYVGEAPQRFIVRATQQDSRSLGANGTRFD